MPFIFNCSCGWSSGVRDGRDVGPKPVVRVCSNCAHEERDGKDYPFTSASETVCPECHNDVYSETVSIRFGGFRNAQVGENEASKVAIHPETGEVVYCFSKPGDVMPERYMNEGFQEKSFTSFRELSQFCRKHDLVNDIEGDYHQNDGYYDEKYAEGEKVYKERTERYLEEREKVMRAYPELSERD